LASQSGIVRPAPRLDIEPAFVYDGREPGKVALLYSTATGENRIQYDWPRALPRRHLPRLTAPVGAGLYLVRYRSMRTEYWRQCQRERRRANYRGSNYQRQRRKALERTAFKCEACGCRDRTECALQCHHVVPCREFNGDWQAANAVSNLIILCHDCHVRAHGMIPGGASRHGPMV